MNPIFVVALLGFAALSCGQRVNPLENVDDVNPFENRPPVVVPRPPNNVVPRQARRFRANMALRRPNMFQRPRSRWMAQPNFGMTRVQPEEAGQGGNNGGAGRIVPEEARVAPNNRFPNRNRAQPAAWQMG